MIKLITTVSVSSFFLGLFGVSWESVGGKIKREFSGVGTVSSDMLLTYYESVNTKLPIIIDVRKGGEFRVSHLYDVLHLERAEAIFNMIAERGLSKMQNLSCTAL